MTTLREFGFNEVCDLQEKIRSELSNLGAFRKYRKANGIYKQLKLSEFGLGYYLKD